MKLHNAFKKITYRRTASEGPVVPDGLMCKCRKCGGAVLVEEIEHNSHICPKCGGYFRMDAKSRIDTIADRDTFREWFTGLESNNPLDYSGYSGKIANLRASTELDEAVITGSAEISGVKTALAVMDGRFLMASMGKVVGEKITRMVEKATEESLPVVIFACSGGARMQEGIVSLMQMAKTSAALKRHSDAGNLYISVLTDPTTGGVTASFAMLGDIILAEPGALIGFAGPRVIEQTIGEKLPVGFQRSEFLLEHGFIDSIVERENMKRTLSELLQMHCSKNDETSPDFMQSGRRIRKYSDVLAKKKTNQKLSAWDKVILSRKNDRPVGEDYIRSIFVDFIELHGDRYSKDDPAVIGGIARLNGCPVTVIAQSKGHNTGDNIKRNFGMPSPEGYRKALRLMKQAEKFGRPVICFVDTPGAFCGLEAEEKGQGEAIARNLFEMSALATPILSIIIGEGGSGGALAMAVADQVWILENSVYSILSPEGYASILWKDSKRAKEAAEVMKMTADELKKIGVVEKVFSEPERFNVQTMDAVMLDLKTEIINFIINSKGSGDFAERRYERFRKM